MSKIWIQEVKEDGFTWVEDTQPTLIMSATREEDEFVVEGPSLLFQKGYYYLFFSAGNYNSSNYHVNVARSEKVNDPDFERKCHCNFFVIASEVFRRCSH